MNIGIRRLKNPFARFIIRFALLMTMFMFAMLVLLYGYAKVMGPPPLKVPVNSTFYGKNNVVIGKSSQTGIRREWVPLEEISTELIEATVAVEDKRFYDHFGFDMKRIFGSAMANLKAGAKVEGASTITMQYARNLFLSHEKTWKRKITETLYAIRLELNYSKDEILEGYLNTIYYGHGAYGVEEAAHYYFQKSAKSLTLSEASLLAGIPKGPSHYSPEHSLEKAKHRQETVLEAMSQGGYITEGEQERAKTEEIKLNHKHEKDKETAPYFLDAVEEALLNDVNLSPATVEAGGLHVYTTLDPAMQEKAEKWIENTMEDNQELQTAFIAIEPETGAVKALVGGRDYTKSKFNRALQAKRAPGSTFKPLLYYAALEYGFTPSTPLLSEKTTFRFNDGKDTYTPANFENQYANDFITLAQAIALSDNTYAVKTHMLIGQDKLVDTAKKMGITSELSKVPSLALGTEPVTVLDMANAYALLANNGKRAEAHFIEKVTDANGNIIYERKAKPKQVLDEDLSFVTTALLTGMFDPSLNGYTSVTGSSIQHLLTRPMAGKSGTTSTDSWMIGYTPQLVTAVWVGYDKERKLHNINDTGYAKKVWVNFMEDALKAEPVANFKPTEEVIGIRIDPKTGKRATDSCPTSRYAYYVKGTEPNEYCTEHEESKKNEKNPPKEEKQKKWWQKFF